MGSFLDDSLTVAARWGGLRAADGRLVEATSALDERAVQGSDEAMLVAEIAPHVYGATSREILIFRRLVSDPPQIGVSTYRLKELLTVSLDLATQIRRHVAISIPADGSGTAARGVCVANDGNVEKVLPKLRRHTSRSR